MGKSESRLDPYPKGRCKCQSMFLFSEGVLLFSGGEIPWEGKKDVFGISF